MPNHFNLALDNGVKPSELSEIITQVAKDIFGKRGITPEQRPPASGELLPLDEAAEAQCAARVEQDAGTVAPGVVYYTGELLP